MAEDPFVLPLLLELWHTNLWYGNTLEVSIVAACVAA